MSLGTGLLECEQSNDSERDPNEHCQQEHWHVLEIHRICIWRGTVRNALPATAFPMVDSSNRLLLSDREENRCLFYVWSYASYVDQNCPQDIRLEKCVSIGADRMIGRGV